MQCKSLKPIVNKESRYLILGSMPGIRSLQQQEYYAHPQNRFWKIMGRICNTQELENNDYKTKTNTLLKNEIALWDVIHSCEREGSLDTSIENEQPNQLKKLLNNYKNIKYILCNGSKAYTSFKKHFNDLENYELYKLPSTSPANANWNLEQLYAVWSEKFFH
ncbi:MAG: DNA-deoxyinosine glycosylase [Candidatus Gastranaerophilales bacterium]|nr:DNA-deoxyinosine glycosylase [Candidatus Gastranaerophilales bacterium]